MTSCGWTTYMFNNEHDLTSKGRPTVVIPL